MSWTDFVEATLTSMCCQTALWRTCTYVRMYIRMYVLSMCACPRYNASYQFWPVFLGSDLLIGRVVSVAMVMAPELPQAVLAKIQGTVRWWKYGVRLLYWLNPAHRS